MQKQQIPLKNSLLLLLAAIIWGIAFVAQSVGMKYVGGFTFNAVRSLIGAVVLIPLIFILKKRNSPSDSASKASKSDLHAFEAETPLQILLPKHVNPTFPSITVIFL